ncbi:MAG: hypothetical protein ACOY4D_03090 [Pseudomonadota bacterium]
MNERLGCAVALVVVVMVFTLTAAPDARAADHGVGPCAQASAEPRETPGEPTERELCLAVAAKYQGVDRTLHQMKESGCGNANRNDPMAAMMCLGASMAGAGGGPQISLAGFHKIACVSAAPSGKPGYICDVATRLKSGNAVTRSMFDSVGGGVSTHRFVKTGGRWLVMPSKD